MNISVYVTYMYVGTVHLCACMYIFVCVYECLYMFVSECSQASDYVLVCVTSYLLITSFPLLIICK